MIGEISTDRLKIPAGGCLRAIAGGAQRHREEYRARDDASSPSIRPGESRDENVGCHARMLSRSFRDDKKVVRPLKIRRKHDFNRQRMWYIRARRMEESIRGGHT